MEKDRDIILGIKEYFRKSPKLYKILMRVFGVSVVGTSADSFFKRFYKQNHVVLNLGSGVKRISKYVLNVDIVKYEGVDIAADILNLPFEKESVDMIIFEDVLEHIDSPDLAMNEIKRVLKIGGMLYLSVPFIFQYHGSPQDYYRWTHMGVRKITEGYMEIELGVRHGPTSAMALAVISWLSILLSFGSQKIYSIFFILFTIILAPWCHIIDPVLSRFFTAKNMAGGFYFIGKKI